MPLLIARWHKLPNSNKNLFHCNIIGTWFLVDEVAFLSTCMFTIFLKINSILGFVPIWKKDVHKYAIHMKVTP
jgi:hypothetical protein